MTQGEYKSAMAQVGRDWRRIMEGVSSVELMYGYVESVNTENNTMNARVGSNSDLVIEDISLVAVEGADASVICYPEVGTTVVLGLPYKQPENAFVVRFGLLDSISIKTEPYFCDFTKENISLSCNDGSRIELNGDKIILNGGKFGGLIKVQELTAKLNALVSIYNAHTHTSSAPSIPTSPSLSPAQPFNATDYENDKVTQ